jgi:hypothetical protein
MTIILCMLCEFSLVRGLDYLLLPTSRAPLYVFVGHVLSLLRRIFHIHKELHKQLLLPRFSFFGLNFTSIEHIVSRDEKTARTFAYFAILCTFKLTWAWYIWKHHSGYCMVFLGFLFVFLTVSCFIVFLTNSVEY